MLTALVSLITVTFTCPGYVISVWIFWEISKDNLTNNLRKHLGDNKLTVNTKIDDNGVTKFMLSGSDGRSSGDYTIEELFAPVTNINGLSYKYATLNQVLGEE